MPVDLLLDKERKTVRTHAWGYVSIGDFAESIEKVIQLQDGGVLDGTWGQIIDMTDATSLDELNEDDIARMVDMNPWPAGTRRAIVVTEERGIHLAKIYRKLGHKTGQEITVVNTIEEAQNWVKSSLPDPAS